MNFRLLIADDDPDSADSLALLLRREGWQVETAYGGEQALAAALAFNPDVLVLDITMPDLDGFQVARRLRALPQFDRKHFVALTSHADQSYLDEASRAQFDDYLIKPCKLNLLLKILSEVAGQLDK